MAVAGVPTASTSSNKSFNHHSTDSFLSSLSGLAHQSLQDHINDYADAHRWIDSFFQKLEIKGPSSGGNASRPAMSELMKTPGRKRVVGANSTNHHSTQPSSVQAAAKKDPLATLLFPSARSTDKENTITSPGRSSSPKKVLSPSSSSTKKSSGIPLSPMRIGSPRPVASNSRSQATFAPRAPAPSVSPAPVIARDFVQQKPKTLTQLQDEIDQAGGGGGDLSNVMEEEEEDDEDVTDEIKVVESLVPQSSEPKDASIIVTEEEKADLSIIGEEEEEEDEEDEEAVQDITDKFEEQVAPVSLPRLAAASSVVIPETQASVDSPARKPAALPASLPLPVLSPQSRSVSGASSVAPDADDDESVPLNDGPSTLRSHSVEGALSSSLPASSSTRTPGGSNARFAAVGSYSAAKIGMGNVNIGSSPPPASSATFAGSNNNSRVSSGGTHQLNFVGLPKKSMGLGLGLGRNWANSTASQSIASDSQGSTQGSQSFATAPTSSSIETTTSSGAIKRKSLTGPDVSSKVAKVSRGSEASEQPRSKIEQLTSRFHTLQGRNSVVAGATGRASSAGIFNSNLFPSTSKPLSSSSSTIFSTAPVTAPVSVAKANPHPVLSSTTSMSTFVATSAVTTETASAPSTGPVRRPSVMERIKSFEYATTTQDHLNPPSPSKIPSAFGRSVSPVPPHSPRGLASPTFAPSSPKPITRSATSGLPLSTFGSPKMATSSSFSPMMGSPKPIPSSFFRSPAPVSYQAPPAPIPAPATLPLAAVSPPRPALTRSTTPPGSPPAVNFQSIFQRLAAPQAQEPKQRIIEKQKKESVIVISDDEEEEEEVFDEEDEDDYGEEEEEEQQSIRPVTKSSTSAADRDRIERAESKAIAKRAREIEEEETEREREMAQQKRLPSLPEPQLLTKDDDEDEDEEEDEELSDREEEPKKNSNARTIVKKATKEDLRIRTSPSKIVMPGTFGAALVAATSNQNSPREIEVEDNEEDGDDENEDDRTTMSMMSTATSTYGQNGGAFRPTKPSTLSKQNSTSSLASSVSSTTALGLNQSIGNGATKKVNAASKVKNAQNAAAAAKKEKEDAERKKAMRDLQERRLQAQKKKQEIERRKQEDERKAKAEELERKRKEREETVAKAKASAARLAAKQKLQAEEENSKKRKMEQETKVPLKKAATQSTRPITASSSTHRISSLANSQSRPVPAPPVNALAKSGGASSMIGQKFMSNQIRLPEGAPRPNNAPSTTIPKPFGLSASQGAMRPPGTNAAQSSAVRQPPSAHKPDPEPYQELPEIDSEYSDSDDEAHEKKVAAFPRWAQSPVLTHQLLEQRKINPDDIFGPIPALSIADMFRNSHSTARLRVRTSSAQWDGTDALTRTDMERYHKAMGFRNTAPSNVGASTSGSHHARDSEQNQNQNEPPRK